MSNIIRSLIVKVGADLTGLQKGMQQASKEMKIAGAEMSKVGKTLTLGLTVPIIAATAASFKLASDMQEAVNKVDVAFKGNASQVKEWSNSTLKQFGIAKGTALDMAALFGDMATGMGLPTAAAAKMSTELVGLAGDMASFKNIRIDVAETALKSIFTGETESLKTLGIIMTQASLDAFALANGYKKTVKEMTEAEKVQLRYAFVLERSKNSVGDFARTGGGAANQMRIFSESLKEVGASFGEQLLPLITPVITKINEVIQSFGKLDEGTKKSIFIFLGMGAAIGPVMSTLGGLTTVTSGVVGALGKASKALSAGSGLIGVLGALIGPAGLALAAIAALAVVIGTVVAITGRAGREIKQMTQDLIESYEKEGAAQKEAVDKASEARINALNERQAAESTASTERLDIIQKEYEKEIKSASKKEQALKKNLQERQSALTESHNNEIQRIRDEYGVFEEKSHSRTDLLNEQYDKDIEKATQAYNEKIALLDAEYAASLRLLDAETQLKIKLFQDQINAIDNKTKEENRLEKERSDNQKILNLQSKIDSEKDAARRMELQQELQNFLTELTRQKTLENRDIEKEALSQRIKEVKKAAEEQKGVLEKQAEQQKKILADNLELEKLALASKRDEAIKIIQEERTAKEDAENKKYNAAKIALDKEEAALDGFVDRYKERLEVELKKKQDIEDAKLKATKDRIAAEMSAEQSRIDESKRLIDEATKRKSAEAAIIAKETVEKKYISPFLPDKETLRDYRILPGAPTIGEMFPSFAGGVKNWAGGLARINERGGEIVNLPSGANVIPHDLSTEMLATMAGQATAAQKISQPTIQLVFNSPIYGMLDFEQKVKQTVKDAARSGAFRGVLTNA